MSKSELLESLERDGFVLVPGLLTQEQITELREAAKETVELAREGGWPFVRTLPKQFPPWNPADVPTHGIWGVQSLMHPQLPRSPTFIRTYFSPPLLRTILSLFPSATPQSLVLELFNLLTRPTHTFQLRWHRDDIPSSASPQEELSRLSHPSFHAQYNMALYPDSSLVVIPGSHRRARTEKEREMGEYETGVEGEIRVKMEPGDVVFYDNNILHRGVYDEGTERMTLHGSVGLEGGGGVRARNVLQHGLKDWVGQIDFSCLDDEQREIAEGMRERLLKMAAESGDVGYSLDG
ncbi:phytanoyl- dioxygenase protein [Rutstroemia sp. NJR-2017a WRK4]|nr:phytanoyl- dioxygenase protein [Rutstroemia sp. NJR-2017a WRK4]